jgi:hypothetical protein
VRDAVIPLDRGLVKHRILVHMGKSEQAGGGGTDGTSRTP